MLATGGRVARQYIEGKFMNDFDCPVKQNHLWQCALVTAAGSPSYSCISALARSPNDGKVRDSTPSVASVSCDKKRALILALT